jgi:hypothetical protein
MKFLLSLIVSSMLFMQPVGACAQFGGKAGIGGKAGTGGGHSSAPPPAYLQSVTGPNCGGTSPCTGNALPNPLTAGSAVLGIMTDHSDAISAMSLSCGSQAGSVVINASGTFTPLISSWLVNNNTSSGSGCTTTLTATAIYGSVDNVEISHIAHGVDGTPVSGTGTGTAATASTPSSGISVTAGDAEVVLVEGTGSGDSCVGLTWKASLGVVNTYSVLVGVAASTGTWTPTCTMGYSITWYLTAFALKP